MDYEQAFKALSDSTRLSIVEMLSCEERCACRLLEKFDITQPTLSHHMKILCDSGLVSGRKEGKWTYYSLCDGALSTLAEYFLKLCNNK